jgi:hypothetical protein
VVTALAFSFMAGIFHAYYTVALAPALAGVVAIGAAAVWAAREKLWVRILAAVTMLGTAVWAYVLLDRASDWLPWLKFVVLAVGIVAAVLLVLPPRGRMLAGATLAVTLVGSLLAPAAYSLETVSTGHSGSIVTAGPTVAGGKGGPGAGRAGFAGRAGGQGAPPQGGTPPGGTAPGGTGTQTAPGQAGTAPGARGGMGNLLGASSVGSALTSMLKADASSYQWAAAAVGSNSAAGYQLATGVAVMPIGGFNGSDPSPTLAQFQAYVSGGEIHYFIGGGVGRSNGGSSASSDIATWVEANFTAQTVDGVTVYDLTK